MSTIDSVYDPKKYERKVWDYWMEGDFFSASENSTKQPFTILMPPPNVTAQLHMGHGLGYSIQDLLTRWKRMKGFNACWLPGTDHAGIATQMMVEKSLEAQGISRQELGREKFLNYCHAWKEKYGGLILKQFKKLGFSCDWKRLAYTMDPKLSMAVRYAFVKLFEEGLIYRKERLVNWDCELRTALSDDELENKDITGNLWYYRYPVEGSSETIPIATTRPETMLGDTAVAVNPEDERYKHLIGKMVRLPFSNRLIPVVADDYVKSEFGTGAVKITPAHDPNDFELGQRHNLPFISILNDDGTLNDKVPERFRGLDRFVARKEVLKGLKELDLFDREEPYRHSVPHSDRSKTIIEPKLSLQWFVSMQGMAGMAVDAAKDGRLRFYPDAWKKTYLYWLENVQDWCISRQLWWGHRIPIWYCKDCRGVTTGMEDPTSCGSCGSEKLIQDEDVLDTWFSSWLWPLSPFGWPEENDKERKTLEYFYPSDVLVTGAEIIFLWVARMVMAGLKFKGAVPFRDIYFNAIVRDKQGRKFSKTLGNGIDPLEVIDRHGTDAVRFTAINLAPLGGQVRMAAEDFETGARFINKIWNATRFVLQNCESSIKLKPLKQCQLTLSEKWLLQEFSQVANTVDSYLESYRINEAVEKIYHFIWGSFCDWALECAKEDLADGSSRKAEALSVLIYVLDGSFRLAHPVIPFITEELWQKLPHHPDWQRANALCIADYPNAGRLPQFVEEAEKWRRVQDVISGIRSIRTQSGIAPKEKLKAFIRAEKGIVPLLEGAAVPIKRLAGLAELVVGEKTERPKASLTDVGAGYETYLPVADLLDIGKERQRITLEIARIAKIVAGFEQKLKNPNFVDKAPEEVVLETKSKKAAMKEQQKKLERTLATLQD